MTNSPRDHLLRFYYSLTIVRRRLYYNTLRARYVNDRNRISGCSFASILLYTVDVPGNGFCQDGGTTVS